MSPNEQVVQRFYEAFEASDADGMAGCYGEDSTFRDIAFELTGKPRIADMWKFECHRRPRIWFGCIRTEADEVKAHWVADYMFLGTRHVNYGIDSRFTVRDGLIRSHRDEASRWYWSRQALGIPMAILVTAFPFALRIKARMELEKFLKGPAAGRG